MENNLEATPPAAEPTVQSDAADTPMLTPQPEGNPPEPAAGKPAGGDEGDAPLLTPEGEPGKAKGAPESYGEFSMPEGFTLEGEELEGAVALFRDLDLTQEQAQKLIDQYTERVLAGKEAELNELAAKRKEWRAEIRQRPGFAQERELALRGMRAVITDPDEKALFENSWMSDHPALWKVFTKIGRMVQEDALPKGSGGNNQSEQNVNLQRFPVA